MSDARGANSTPLATIATALRRERDRTGMSLTELARQAGIAKSTVSQLESGTGNPSVETLWALAVALETPFSRLVDPPRPHLTVLRAGQAPVVRSDQSSYAAALLSACPAGARRDLYLLELSPGQPRIADAHNPGTVEHLLLTSGRARTGPRESPVELDSGDYVSFSGDVPHVYEALAPGTTVVLLMEHG